MVEEQTAKVPMGTWANLLTEELERKPKINFEIGKEVEVLFTVDEPREYQGDNGAFYVFDVEQYNKEQQKYEPQVIITAAWSLLRGLKAIQPLKDRRVKIIKTMEKGKQFFKVTAEQIEEQVEDSP